MKPEPRSCQQDHAGLGLPRSKGRCYPCPIVTRQSVELRVGGKSYRVVSSASGDELRELALLVDSRLSRLSPSGTPGSQGLLLVALELAHELRREQSLRAAAKVEMKSVLAGLLTRIDGALTASDPTSNGRPAVPFTAPKCT